LTLRRINRLASQVEVLLTLVGPRDLNFTDAVLLTFIRLWYPALYDQLPQWQSDLAKYSRVMPYSTTRDAPTGSVWSSRIADTLAISGDQRTDDPELEAVTRLMSTLFPGALLKGGMRHDDEPCRIDSREYFARYFALAIPAGDISDGIVHAELSALVASGELASNSPILAMLANAREAAILLRKVLRVVDVITESRGGKPAAAARFLNSALPDGDRLFGRWGTVLNALLSRAVCEANTPQDAQSVIDEFAAHAGLLATAEVLYGSAAVADTAEMAAASRAVEARVLEACRRDLTSDVATDPEALTCLHFRQVWSFLPADIIDQLAAFAGTLMGDGIAKAHEIAGRFVVVPAVTDSPSALDAPSFFTEEFETLVPRSKWARDELPQTEVEIVRGDRSLANRINFAAQAMRKQLTSEADSARS